MYTYIYIHVYSDINEYEYCATPICLPQIHMRAIEPYDCPSVLLVPFSPFSLISRNSRKLGKLPTKRKKKKKEKINEDNLFSPKVNFFENKKIILFHL